MRGTTMMDYICRLFEWLAEHFFNFIAGIVLMVISYLIDIRGSIHVMWLAMFVDLVVGIAKSVRIDKVPFSGKKFRYWVEFAAICTLTVILAYSAEKEMVRNHAGVYNGFTLIITGFTLYSILKNGERLTGRRVFTALTDFVGDKFKQLTGIDFKKYEDDQK